MGATTFVPLGRVVKPHGLDGEFSVALADGVTRLPLGLEVWFVPPPDGPRSGRIVGVRQGPKGPLVLVSGVSHIRQAESLRGCDMMADSQDVQLEAVDSRVDLIGYSVTDTTRGLLGSIIDVIITGANDVLVVEGGPFGQVLIPVIDDVVHCIDDVERSCSVTLLPGLIEDDR